MAAKSGKNPNDGEQQQHTEGENYASIREVVCTETALPVIKEKYPMLFNLNEFKSHFSRLTSCNVNAKLDIAKTEKLPGFYRYCILYNVHQHHFLLH